MPSVGMNVGNPDETRRALGQHGLDEEISIGEACRLLNVSSNTLRRWERRGLIVSERSQGGHRRYRMAEIIWILRKRMTDKNGGTYSVGTVQPPCIAMPRVAESLACNKNRLIEVGTVFYKMVGGGGHNGYFSTRDAEANINKLLESLESDLKRGIYEQSLVASRQISAGAVAHRTCIIECYRFWEFLMESVYVAIGSEVTANQGRDKGKALRTLLRALKHAYIDEIDSPNNLICLPPVN